MSSKEVDELWAEIIHDREALDYLKTAADINEIKDEGQKGGIKTSTQIPYNVRYWQLSAALVLIAGVFFVFQTTREATNSIQPLERVELNYYRSAEGMSDDEAILRKAIVLANEGNYDKAVRIIDVELNQTNDVHTKSLLLLQSGSILYNTARYREALFRFNRLVKNAEVDLLVREKAYWYAGNSYFQLNEPEAAKKAFQKAYELDGAYSRVAEKYLTTLEEM